MKVVYAFLGFVLFFPALFPASAFPQEGEPGVEAPVIRTTVPEALRRPQRDEAVRLPQDIVIGELGQGQAPQGAYRFARDIVSALAAGNSEAAVLAALPQALIAGHIQEIGGIDPASYRVGGGRTEADGTISFLIRFLGREESITGELFVQQDGDGEQGPWLLDDIILEEKMTLAEIRDRHRFVFSPYERFF
ncbi:MAG: hypothetical protein FWC64_02175 [Treponema sp.]|nr:hypothetical protein [Treponema sp.]